MKRLHFLGLTLVLASPLAAQWTEGGARIGANLDTLAVTFQNMGTLFRLEIFGDAADMYILDTTGTSRVSLWGDGASGGGQLNLYDGGGTFTIGLIGGATGNSAVIFPVDAIASEEILDEPGVASSSNGGSGIDLSGTGRDTLLAQSIVVPDTGFLLIVGSAQVSLYHTNGTISGADFGLMLDGTVPNNQDVHLGFSANTPSGSYSLPVAVQMLAPVGPGTHDVVFWGDLLLGGAFTIFDMQLSVVYLPTAYGTVAKVSTANIPDAQAPRRTVTPSAQQIRAESEAANQARLERELANIRAQLEALERAMMRK